MSIILRAEIDANGQLRLLDPLPMTGPRQVEVEIRDTTAPLDSTASTKESPPGDGALLNWRTRYRVISTLGYGGMGITYKTEDTASGKLVCIKQLHPGVTERSLLQECRALSKLSHPHIVRLLDFDLLEQPPYLVLEYVKGLDLSTYVRQLGRPWAEGDVTVLSMRIADALAFAHDQGVIHRDLKPANIKLAEPAETLMPKLLDFGLAIVEYVDMDGAATARGNVAGTLVYMAPEQMQGQRLTTACDVYALGQVMWELIAGARAYGDNVFEMMKVKARPDGITLSAEQCGNRDLAALIGRMTVKYPERRPTAKEVAHQLRQWASRLN